MKKKKWASIVMSAALLSAVLYEPSFAADQKDFFEVKTDSDVSVNEIIDSDVTALECAVGKPENAEESALELLSEGTFAEKQWLTEARTALAEIVQEREIMALVYLSDEYPVRVSPSYDSETAVTVLSGQPVNILDIEIDENGEAWEYVSLEYDGREIYGYVPRSNLACSDARFLEWEFEYGTNPSKPMTFSIMGASTYSDVEQFPESYQSALLSLKQQHPNWTFVVMNTNLDWNTAIYNEMQGGRSLVHRSLAEWTKNGMYGTDVNWYYATEEALKLYMDPRSHLTESDIFQFELLTYNEDYHTKDAVEKFLNNTFMNNSKPAPGMDQMTYADIFWVTGVDKKVSPFHLVARVLQEQGQGTSALISGTYSTADESYVGYYNYFNIGASGTSSAEVIKNGLSYAKQAGWNNAYYSIMGGAEIISANYIHRGQNTLYLQKFNVTSASTYNHQYMQNISAPTTEAASIKKLYESTNALDSPFVFTIPVYLNMPKEACGTPPVTTDVSLSLPSGYTDTTVWLDGVPYQGTMKDGKLVVHAPNANAKTAVVYQYNASGVPVNMYVWSLRYNGTFYVATAEPGLENLLSYHGFSIRITGKSGIRFKTGISTALRSSLTTTGVNGYTLKEYGTLIMNNANRGQYAMVMGGEKVASGMAYGTDSSGKRQDVIYETVDGRYRYTSVLVGMPPEQYKTEYAFRGYAVLEKDGKQIVIYGPVVARSIYSLAEQLLEQGSYAPGTSAYEFLQKLIHDADSV